MYSNVTNFTENSIISSIITYNLSNFHTNEKSRIYYIMQFVHNVLQVLHADDLNCIVIFQQKMRRCAFMFSVSCDGLQKPLKTYNKQILSVCIIIINNIIRSYTSEEGKKFHNAIPPMYRSGAQVLSGQWTYTCQSTLYFYQASRYKSFIIICNKKISFLMII